MSDAQKHIRQIGKRGVYISAFDAAWVAQFNRSEVTRILNWADKKTFDGNRQYDIQSLFQLDTSENDALNTAPLDWSVYLRETQVTDTIAHYLNHGSLDIRKARVRAFLKIFDDDLGNEAGDFFVRSEHPVEVEKKQGRIDLFIGWGESQNNLKYREGLVCEFKIDSAFGDRQLKKYEDATENSLIDNPRYAFISRQYKTTDIQALNGAGKWHCRLWWKFLRDWEQGIAAEQDSESFRLFRSTLWDQVT